MSYLSLGLTILGILTGLGILTTAFVVVKSNLAKTTAELWKGEAEAYKESNERLEKLVDECKVKIEAVQKENEHLKHELSIIRSVVTGETHSEALKDYLEVLHQESITQHKEILTEFKKLNVGLKSTRNPRTSRQSKTST